MTKIVVILGFCVAFAAGLVVGMGLPQPRLHNAAATTRPGGHRGWLAAELNLTPQQQEQLDKIWSDTARRGGREHEERRRELRRERDEAVASLIPSEDKTKFEQVQKKYSDEMAASEKEMRSSFQASVEKTKQILTPEQRTKYEEILKRWDHGGRERDGRRGEDRATSRPVTQP